MCGTDVVVVARVAGSIDGPAASGMGVNDA